MREAPERIALELGRLGTAHVVSAVNERAARHIVKQGVIPGEIDSVDLWRAEGYLEAIEKAKVLEMALVNIQSFIHGRIEHGRGTNMEINIDIDFIDPAIAKWEKDK